MGPEDGVDAPLIDPFSDQALSYDPTRRIVWSVGPHGKAERKDRLTFSIETGDTLK
ncbi:hypothetical protein OP10G_1245 [Fimbriimonas ginsengisoli Gsoil 348]|uniref:Uncharacterized protein n=1 Tax=Fimbriimonas ginsengisoli Gsoil 348 TaxID=661478 RepID=A0A068NM39_FIMGI|nr:hypothetical protein OP10G_1245 [Fimbriimonas ginsengisoli Gsoil 348]